eukprot:GILI01001915.1.p1 GENE.GILI01001915.1~~GILI01001915.1.p1  ORF type:complete len:1543 (+),score=376.49 GILI01001915.1:381-4631(+)
MHKVLIAPMPDIEIAALVRYIVLTRNMRRVAVMTTYGIGLGNDLIPYIKSLLAEFGLELTYQYVIGLPSKSIGLQAAEGAVKRPQALLQLGSIDVSTVSGIFAVYGTMDPSDCLIGSPGISYPLLVTAFSLLPAGSAGVGRLITSTYSPLQTDPNFQAASEYMRSLTANPSVVYFKKEALVGANFGYGVFAMTGFLIGNLMTSVFSSLGNNTINAQSIIDKTFSGWLVPAYDYVFGPYTTPCEGWRTISCGCHSGARQVHMAYFDAQLEMHPLPNAIYDISLDVCLPQNVQIQSPLIQLMATPNTTGLTADQRALVVAAHELYVAGDRAGYVNVSTSPSSRTGILLNTTYKSYTELATLQINRLTTVSTGSVYVDTIDAVSVNLTVALDPIYTSAPLYGGYSERVIHLGPTLQQEIHAFALAYAGANINAMSTGDSDFNGDLHKYFSLSAHTFGYEFGSVSGASSLASGLAGAGDGILFIHGIKTQLDIDEMNALLGRAAGAILLVPFQHVALWYDSIINTITAPARRARVVFATNLPNWNPQALTAAANTTLMQSYYASMKESGLPFTPQTLRGFLTQRLVANIVERIPSKLTQDTFLATLYAVSVVVLDANAYSIGPLSSAACQDSTSSTCESNAGARQVVVRSLQSATASDTASANAEVSQFAFSSASISYQPLPAEAKADTTVIIIAVVAGSVVLIFIVLLILVCCCSGRSHGNAPKDASKPFSLIFTDIQSSTSLWAEVPDDMAKAIDIHHRLIRELIKKYNGYEVKTIGDAFMIAFKNADDAVKLSYALQDTFFNCQEFPNSIDHAYLAFDREKMMEAGIDGHDTPDNGSSDGDAILTKPPSQMYIRSASTLHLRNLTAYLAPDDYNRMWHGIRVRIGINTAFGDIKKDEVTQAYDYYGTVTNTAARVESVAHGGQVLLTKGTYEALSSVTIQLFEHQIPADQRSTTAPKVALKMGQVELRGLVDRVELYQLECIAGREYPPLRLDRADDLDEELRDGTEATDPYPTADQSTQRTASTIHIIQPSPGPTAPMISTTAASSSTASHAEGLTPKDGTHPTNAAPAFKLDLGKTHGAGGYLGTGDNKSDGGASVLSFRPPGPGGAGGGNVNLPSGELHSSQFMAAVATVFSIIPTDKRGKELKRLCELWRITIDEKKLNKSKNSIKKPPSTKNMTLGVGKKNDDRMSYKPSEHPSTEPFSRLTSQLTGGDGLSALCLEALAKRLKNVAGKKLNAAVIGSGGTIGANATPNGAAAGAGGLLGVGGGFMRTESTLKGKKNFTDTASYNGVAGVSPRVQSVRTTHSNDGNARAAQITWQISASGSNINMNTVRASNSDMDTGTIATKDNVTAYSRHASDHSHTFNVAHTNANGNPTTSGITNEISITIPALTVNVPDDASPRSEGPTITIAVPEME